MRDRLERNLQLIPLHELLVRTSPWLAVFVLFTRSEFDLDGAVRLAGLYYLAVVAFEVPSGWMSDRIGRSVTLRLAGASWIGAFTCFLLGAGAFSVVALGQILLALGYAALSGTDVTFHFDTLEALGREDQYARRQSIVASRGLVIGAAGVLLGGLVGAADVRWAFAISLLLAVAQLVVAFGFTEPPRTEVADGPLTQMTACARYLGDGTLAWIFGYGVAMVVLEHVAFTPLQPWLTEALGNSADELGSTPIVAGATLAGVALVGAAFARAAAAAAARWGVRLVLVLLGVLSASIVTAMAATFHLAVLVAVAFRSAQGAAAPVLISAAVAPRVEARHRATLLSLNSLAGRGAYGALLLVVSTELGDDVARVLRQLSVVSWALVVATGATAVLAHRRSGPLRA